MSALPSEDVALDVAACTAHTSNGYQFSRGTCRYCKRPQRLHFDFLKHRYRKEAFERKLERIECERR